MVVFSRTALNHTGAENAAGRKIDPLRSEIDMLGTRVSDRRPSGAEPYDRFKRAFDICIASVALVLLLPLIVVAAIVIKAESSGPVFFTQERIGLNRRRGDRRRSGSSHGGPDRRKSRDRRKNLHAGKPFSIYKFRTMSADAEKSGPALAHRGDPRITRIGGIMRRTRIDEIPQFINVIKGDMSIIGPRPERSFFINKIRSELPEFPLRLNVKPGITGLAQVESGYTETLDKMKDKLYYDLKYISELSLAQELKIIFKTFFVVVSGKGAC